MVETTAWMTASAALGVHWDSRGHTGAMMSMGKGAIVNIARKQKNECSEFDGVGTSKYRRCPGYDFMVQVLHRSTGVHDREQSPVPR